MQRVLAQTKDSKVDIRPLENRLTTLEKGTIEALVQRLNTLESSYTSSSLTTSSSKLDVAPSATVEDDSTIVSPSPTESLQNEKEVIYTYYIYVEYVCIYVCARLLFIANSLSPLCAYICHVCIQTTIVRVFLLLLPWKIFQSLLLNLLCSLR